MKIAQVCHRYYPNIGGIENHVKEISERLAMKNEVEVISADLSSSNLPFEIINGVGVRRFNSIGPKNAYFFSPQILFYLRKADFDIIHVHNYNAIPALLASLAKEVKVFPYLFSSFNYTVNRKFVFTPHYHEIGSSAFRNFLIRPYKLFGARIFRKADKIICVSEYERELIKRNFKMSEDKMVIVPNGISLKEIREAKPFDFDGNLILYVGRLEKYKNIHLVIKAMKFLPESYFYIGGTGSYEKELRNLIHKLGLEGRVKLLGFVPDGEKYRWMKTCSLFVNLSGIEAFGMTVLEALAAGKPVIVNEEGGLKELADKFEGVFPVDAKEVSAEGLARVMEERIGGNVRADLDEYTWDNVAEKVEKIYEEIK